MSLHLQPVLTDDHIAELRAYVETEDITIGLLAGRVVVLCRRSREPLQALTRLDNPLWAKFVVAGWQLKIDADRKKARAA